ncbi:winged helix-turn-helix domain-containing protein [Streptomyces sp. NPDC003442]
MCPGARRLYETVVDSILELVEVGRSRPGDALPADRELSEVFGVSRNVLRQAFGVLEERGLLRTVRGSGGPEGRRADTASGPPRAHMWTTGAASGSWAGVPRR